MYTTGKHWLRGLCKKGDQCDYLHRYDLSQMPECHFFAQNGECHNMECLFRHVDPESKKGDCQWFARGFCRHGPYCKNRHVKKVHQCITSNWWLTLLKGALWCWLSLCNIPFSQVCRPYVFNACVSYCEIAIIPRVRLSSRIKPLQSWKYSNGECIR